MYNVHIIFQYFAWILIPAAKNMKILVLFLVLVCIAFLLLATVGYLAKMLIFCANYHYLPVGINPIP